MTLLRLQRRFKNWLGSWLCTRLLKMRLMVFAVLAWDTNCRRGCAFGGAAAAAAAAAAGGSVVG